MPKRSAPLHPRPELPDQLRLARRLAKAGQFCIDIQLSAAFRGEVDKGLFFRGKDPLPFGNAIRTVQETIHYLLNGSLPVVPAK